MDRSAHSRIVDVFDPSRCFRSAVFQYGHHHSIDKFEFVWAFLRLIVGLPRSLFWLFTGLVLGRWKQDSDYNDHQFDYANFFNVLDICSSFRETDTGLRIYFEPLCLKATHHGGLQRALLGCTILDSLPLLWSSHCYLHHLDVWYRATHSVPHSCLHDDEYLARWTRHSRLLGPITASDGRRSLSKRH